MTESLSHDKRSVDKRQGSVEAAYQIVQRMAGANGCAWHEEQTHASLTRYLIEETYELVDAIDHGAPASEMVTELADVLYQVLFHAAIAERDETGYGLAEIADELSQKLILRHPHVFGDRGYMTADELKEEWEHLKEDAAGNNRGSRKPLEGIPTDLPTLARATKVIERLTRAGLIVDASWFTPQPESNTGSSTDITTSPEIDIDTKASTSPEVDTEAVIGDELLETVRKAISLGIDPDAALRKATNSFSNAAMARSNDAQSSNVQSDDSQCSNVQSNTEMKN